MKKTLRVVMLTVALALVLLSMTACGKTKLDIAEGLSVDFSGVDGYGHAEIVYPGYDGTPPYVDEILESNKISADNWEALFTLSQAISCEVEPVSHLSNGDKVVVTIDVDEAVLNNLGFSAEDKTITFTVEGLTEVVPIYPFENFEIKFSGVSPDVIAEYTHSQEINGAHVSYKIEESAPYKDGEVLTIRASIGNNEYYRLEEETMQVTVSGVDKYITSAEEILPATMDAMKAKADQLMSERFRVGAPTDFYQFGEFYYAGYMFLARGNQTSMGDKNVCYLVYTVDVIEDGKAYTSTYYFSFANILQRLDGTQEINVDKAARPFDHWDYQLKNYQTVEARCGEIEKVWGNGYFVEKIF